MSTAAHSTVQETDIWDALREVPDPELPVVSVVDLGVILRVDMPDDRQHVRILLLPTFQGCPALEQMRAMIRERVEQLGVRVEVEVSRDELWSSDRISQRGRAALTAAGIAPPGPSTSSAIELLEPTACPHCGSRRTTIDSAFGPTPCRGISYCRDCRQPFEHFKPL